MVSTEIGVSSRDFDLLQILRRGPEVWNRWREQNPRMEVDFCNADLRGADLRGADLRGADLRGANLRGANLKGAIISDETKLDSRWRLVLQLLNEGGQWKDLSDADLSGANLIGANLSRANLSGANLSRTKLWGANLSRANLSRANLSVADLSVANLKNADLIGAGLSRVNLSVANLSYSNLKNADLTKADLSGSDLSYANLRKADLSNANILGSNLSYSNLSYSNLKNANLFFANLIGANLFGANLFGANLIGANLFGAIIPNETQFDIRVFDKDITPNDLEQLKAAIDKYTIAAGYEEIAIISEKYGSWIKRIRNRIARIISQNIQEEAINAGQEFYRSGKSSALNLLEKTGVESTKQIVEATAEILKAVENLDDVVLLLGKLIVMKYTNDDGRSKTYVKTISSDLQLKLESTPQLLDSPQAIIDFLHSKEELPLAIEEQKTLPATLEVLK